MAQLAADSLLLYGRASERRTKDLSFDLSWGLIIFMSCARDKTKKITTRTDNPILLDRNTLTNHNP